MSLDSIFVDHDRCGIISSDPALSDGRNDTCYQVHPTDTIETLLTFRPRDYCLRKSKIHFRLNLGSSLGNKTCGSLEKMFYSQMNGCNSPIFRVCKVIDTEITGTEGQCDIECFCDDGDGEECNVHLLPQVSTNGSVDFNICEAHVVYEWTFWKR